MCAYTPIPPMWSTLSSRAGWPIGSAAAGKHRTASLLKIRIYGGLMAIVVKKHEVEFIKVPGHADCEENNRCDALARAEIDKFRKINPDAAPQT